MWKYLTNRGNFRYYRLMKDMMQIEEDALELPANRVVEEDALELPATNC